MGPLAGVKVVELAGIGPGPMCAMVLADLGAEVLRIDRPAPSGLGVERPLRFNLLLRGRKAVAVDLKTPEGVALVLKLVEKADALIEGFRPGVTERLGLGPDICLARNPRLVYGRMTGWGQSGTLAHAAGHDINYIALVGALNAIGRRGQLPAPPMNVVGDFAGGALYLAIGVLCGIIEARHSGQGQVVDAAITDGTAHLMTQWMGMVGAGLASHERGTNHVDGGAHFYDVYECADGKLISIAAIEGKFYGELLHRLEIDPATLPDQKDRAHWPEGRDKLAAHFKTRDQAEWCRLLEGTDACFAPVLTTDEAAEHPHNKARDTYLTIDGVLQPAAAPRFSRTIPEPPTPPRATEKLSAEALKGWLDAEEVTPFLQPGVPA